MFPNLQLSSDSFRFGQSASAIDWSSLILMFAIMIAAVFTILFCYLAYLTIRRFRSQSSEWHEFNRLIQQSDLSREEKFFIRQTLKNQGVTHPLEVMEEPEVYARIVEKPLERAGDHTHRLIMSIRRKIVGSNLFHQEIM